MSEKDASALHNTKNRLSACLKYCELRSKKEVTAEDRKYVAIWHMIALNERKIF